ncbi:MAG TPA: extracellular solute-binding protein [Herbaspirillum sp.]|jgi:iron(III) transport system substrate-binding protein
MKNVMRMFAISALLCGNSITAFAQSATDLANYTGADRTDKLVAAAKKEGTLTLYTPTPAEYMRLLTDPFEKKYGIKVVTWRALSEQVLQRTIQEARAGKNTVDVVQNLAVSMEALHRESLLMPVTSPYTKYLIQDALPAHREWVPTMHYVYAQAYNTAKVKKADLPKTYNDLLDPKWKGKLAIEGGDYDWFDEVLKEVGQQKGKDLFCQLGANGLSVRNGHSLLTSLVASGEVPMALTLYQYNPAQMKAKGAPIDWFVIEPAIAINDGIGIPKKAPHPNAALLFYDFMLSDEGQTILAKIGYVPVSTRVESPMKGIKIKRLNAAELLDGADKGRVLFDDVVVNRSACK